MRGLPPPVRTLNGPGLKVVNEKKPFESTSLRPNPVKAALAPRAGATAYRPCTSACHSSSMASTIGSPSPSRT
jgi:hypothetical protein